jgi:CubicO group peptidase (beta-lactamase class C family)
MMKLPPETRSFAVLLTLLAITIQSIADIAPVSRNRNLLASAAMAEFERQGFVGSVLVAKDGEIIYSRDSGLEKEPKAVPSYWIASITKQFVAAGILLLQQREQLNIHDSITEYLPNVPADKSNITIFQLLTHTSGLSQMYAADDIADKEKALESLLRTELEIRPGEQFSYANDNYNILAIILENVSGQNYEDFLRTEILVPAGMQCSGFWGEPADNRTYVPPVITQLPDISLQPNWGFKGATGMRASVQDLFAWTKLLKSEKLLSRDSVALLMGNHVELASGTKVGFNWFGQYTEDGIYTQFSRGHESFGGNTVIYLYPALNVTIVTATNAGPAETGEGPVSGWSRETHKALANIFLAN